MEKPKSLRALLTNAVPEFKRNPAKLEMYMKAGKIHAWLSRDHMSYEYRYDLEIVILEYDLSPDTIFMPIVQWLSSHEVAALQNHDRNGFEFEVDILDDKTVDISITLKLTEAIDVKPREGGGFTMTAREETPMADDDPMFPPPHVNLTAIYDQHDNLLVPYPVEDDG